jgi:hypothetical protein
MANETVTQVKGQIAFVWGAIPVVNLTKEASITYEVGQSGDVLSTLNDVVHIMESRGSIVSGITITLPKGTSEIALIDAQILANTPFPLLVRDAGLKTSVAIASASCTQIAVSDSSGDSSIETISYTFKGNMTRVAL